MATRPREHTDYECPKGCHYPCQWCDGGLWACSVCNSFEGATTSECPGERMSYEVSEAVYDGHLDFVDGEWKWQCSPHTPAFHRIYRRAQDGS